MNESAEDVLFLVFMGLGFAWGVLLLLFMNRLILRRMTLFDDFTRGELYRFFPKFRVVRFILTRAHRTIGDRLLGLYSDALLLIIVAVVTCVFLFAVLG